MKQPIRALAGFALAAALLTGSAFAAVPAAPENSCVLDEAGVLSERTEQAVNDLTIALSESCGAEIAVLTVDFTGTSSTADYANEALNSWAVGDKDKNNGVLLLLVIDAEDYYCTVGTGLEKELTPQKIDDLLWNNLEEGFAAGDYDAGVTAFTNAVYDELCDIYDVQPGQSTGGAAPAPAPAPESPSFLARLGSFFTLAVVLVVLILLVVLSSILHPVRYVRSRWFGYGYPPPPPRRPFFGGWSRRPPPPPRPPRSGGPGGFGGPGPGGFGGGPSRPSSSSRPQNFGGFGGGSGRGSGAGRRSGGGSRSGGGAGRRK